MADSTPEVETLLLNRFSAFGSLADDERALLAKFAARPKTTYLPGATLWNEDETRPSAFIVSGWACVSRQMPTGGRQIIELLLPGDVVGFGIQHRPAALGFVSALTAIRMVDASEIGSVWRERHLSPRFSARLEALLAEQLYFLANQITRLGRASANQRVANLFAELNWRLERRGLAHEAVFPMPLTQEQIADTLGLSVVHVNRTLQQLRRGGSISQERGQVKLLKPDVIEAAGGFVPPAISVT